MKQEEIDMNIAYFAGIDILLENDTLEFAADVAPSLSYDGEQYAVNSIRIAKTSDDWDNIVPEVVLSKDDVRRTVHLKPDGISQDDGYNLIKAVFDISGHKDFDYEDVDEFYGYELS